MRHTEEEGVNAPRSVLSGPPLEGRRTGLIHITVAERKFSLGSKYDISAPDCEYYALGSRWPLSRPWKMASDDTIPDRVWNFPRESAVAIYLGSHSQEPSDAEVQSIQEQKVCAGLKSAVSQAVAARANRELGIFASASEIENRRNRLANDPDWKASQAPYRERLEALVAGLSAVYDQGKDPQQVYQQLVAPHNVQQFDWAQNLYLGKTKEFRQKLAKDLAGATPEGFAKAQANFDARPAVEDEKRNAAIDALLAANDPKFKAYLNEWNANTIHISPNHARTNVGADVKAYLDQKRAAWWKAETAKLNVTLSDPSLYAACDLPAQGVTVPRH